MTIVKCSAGFAASSGQRSCEALEEQPAAVLGELAGVVFELVEARKRK